MKYFEMKDSELDTFTKFPDWLMYTDLGPAARVVYLALWSHYRAGGGLEVHPSIARICWLANVGPTCAREAIKELREAGLVSVKGRKNNGGGSNQFLLYEPSESEIRTLVGRRKQRSLTSGDTKLRRCDQAPPESGGAPSESGGPPSESGGPAFGIRCRSRTNEEDPENQIQEPHPDGPAFGGAGPDGDSRRPLRGQKTTGFLGDLSSTNESDDWRRDLRARLERHV